MDRSSMQEEQISDSFLYRCAVEALEGEDRGIRNTRKIDSKANPMLGKKEGREEKEINVRGRHCVALLQSFYFDTAVV